MTEPKQQPKSLCYKQVGILILVPILFGTWLVLTSITEIFPSLGLYDNKRILELWLIPLTLSLVLFDIRVRHALNAVIGAIPSWVQILLLIFFGLGLCSALLTPNPAYPLLDVAMLFMLILMTISIACARILYGSTFDRVALVLIALMGLVVVLQEIVGLLVYLSSDQQFNYREALFHFLHPRLYNQVQTWTIPVLALLPMVFTKYRWMSLLSIFLIGAQWYIILTTGARGSTISLLLAMFFLGVFLPTSRSLWVKIHVTGLILGILFYISAVSLLSTAQPDKTSFVGESVGRPMLHTSGRTDLWKHAIEDAVQNPMMGAGPMRYACGVTHYIAGSPHSFPLQILGEWGIPAFLVLAVLFFWLVSSWKKAVKLSRKHSVYQQGLVACLSISCFAAIIHVCVSGLLIAPSSQVAGTLVTGWLLGCIFKDGSEEHTQTSTNSYRAPLLAFLGFVVSVSVLVFALMELDTLQFRTSYAQDYGPTTPRFWQDGRFCKFSF